LEEFQYLERVFKSRWRLQVKRFSTRVRFASSTWNVPRFWNTKNEGLQLFQNQVKKATQKSIRGFT